MSLVIREVAVILQQQGDKRKGMGRISNKFKTTGRLHPVLPVLRRGTVTINVRQRRVIF
jgi:hypothetical protein